jgi:N-formylmaleamate deformylase
LSESGSHLDYGLDACADDVLAFGKALGLTGYTILGHSMGARIAIRASTRAGPELAGLVLADPPVSGPGRRPYPSPLEAVLKLLAAARRGKGESALRLPGVAPWPEDLLRIRAEWLHTCDERAAVDAHRSFHEDDIHADIANIKIPCALIMAGKGGVILPEDEAEIRKLAPAMEMRRVANAGHQMQVDDPEGFFAALGSVLGQQV